LPKPIIPAIYRTTFLAIAGFRPPQASPRAHRAVGCGGKASFVLVFFRFTRPGPFSARGVAIHVTVPAPDVHGSEGFGADPLQISGGASLMAGRHAGHRAWAPRQPAAKPVPASLINCPLSLPRASEPQAGSGYRARVVDARGSDPVSQPRAGFCRSSTIR